MNRLDREVSPIKHYARALAKTESKAARAVRVKETEAFQKLLERAESADRVFGEDAVRLAISNGSVFAEDVPNSELDLIFIWP